MANPRHRIIIRQVLSPLIGEEEEIGVQSRAGCVGDYSPCSCSVYFDNKISVTCRYVSVETVREVFQRMNDREIYKLSLYMDAATNTRTSLPPDFLGNTSVTHRIFIQGSKKSNLVIDPLAFRSSQNSLVEFSVSNVDFGLQNNFSFLNEFNKLEGLHIIDTINLAAFQFLPPLPSLKHLSVANCPSEFNQIAFPDLRSAELKKLELNYNEISDQTADEIVAKLAASTSADSLESLDLHKNSLTRIPSHVGSAFPNLKTVSLYDNNISYISSFSLTFSSPYLESLYLFRNKIKTIERGAFRGKYTD